MGFLKVLITIILLIASLGGVLLLSFKIVQDDPFGTGHNHELTLVAAKDPICDKAGIKEHYFCKGCNGIFADKNGYAPLTAEEITVAPLGHNFENLSCAGVKKCEICGTIEGVGSSHTPGVTVRETVKNATCVAEGEYYSITICQVCGQEASRELLTTPFSSIHINNNGDEKCDFCGKEVCKEHVPVIDAAVAATCTSEGLTEGSHCSVCNTSIVPQQVVPPSHNIKFNVKGVLTVNADGSYNTDNLVVGIGCAACELYPNDIIKDYTISAEKPFETGGVISYGEHKFEFPALDYEKYDLSSTYNGNDETPTVVTAFTLKGTEFAYGVITNHCIDLVKDDNKTVYSIYELDKLNNENVTVTYDAEKGYLYSSKNNHTVSYLMAYGADLTVTGDVHVLTATRLNVNSHLIVGTDDVSANLKVERAEDASSNNEIIALWQSGNLTIMNGTLTTVGKATKENAVDIRVGAKSDTNPTAKSVIYIAEKGKFVTEGTGQYAVFFNKDSEARIIVDGTVTSNRSFVVASNYNIGSEYEYGFEPALYIRKGSVTITDSSMPFCVSSFQLGSEKENATGTLSIKSSVDAFRMALKEVNMTFAKGTFNYTATVTDKTGIQTGGDGSGAAYYPYNDPSSTKGHVVATIDIKKDTVINATGTTGKPNYFIGCWRAQTAYVQNWLIEYGAQFNLTDISYFAYIKSGSNVKLIAYEEAQLSIDGAVKKVLVAAKLVGGITAANSYSDLVFPEFDASATWTTDSAASGINGFKKATDTNGNSIYYK